MPKRKYDIQGVWDLHKQGMSVYAISQETGASPATVYRYIDKVREAENKAEDNGDADRIVCRLTLEQSSEPKTLTDAVSSEALTNVHKERKKPRRKVA